MQLLGVEEEMFSKKLSRSTAYFVSECVLSTIFLKIQGSSVLHLQCMCGPPASETSSLSSLFLQPLSTSSAAFRRAVTKPKHTVSTPEAVTDRVERTSCCLALRGLSLEEWLCVMISITASMSISFFLYERVSDRERRCSRLVLPTQVWGKRSIGRTQRLLWGTA
jgi:hypothetical protein